MSNLREVFWPTEEPISWSISEPTSEPTAAPSIDKEIYHGRLSAGTIALISLAALAGASMIVKCMYGGRDDHSTEHNLLGQYDQFDRVDYH